VERLGSVAGFGRRWPRYCIVAVAAVAGTAALTSCTVSSHTSTSSSRTSSLNPSRSSSTRQGSSSPSPASPSSSNSSAAGPAAHIVFVSDQSVILARHSSFRFMVKVEGRSGKVLHIPLHWSSQAPSQVAVVSDGTATALADTGSVNISVSAPGAQPNTAQVIMASPAPGTVMMPGTEIMDETSTSVTLQRNSQTAAIKPGQILVGDARNRLLAKVTKIIVGTSTVTIFTAPASLASAFSGLAIATESAQFSTLMPTDTQNLRNCELSSGHSEHVRLVGSGVSVRIKVRLVADLQISHQVVKEFKLAVNGDIPVTVSSGTVTVYAAGDVHATCDFPIPPIDIPTPVFLGPVEIDGHVTLEAGIDVKVGAGAAMTFSGPTVSDTVQALDGMEYTQSGGWQQLKHNPITGPKVTSAGRGFNAPLMADVAPYLQVGFGISAALDDCGSDLCNLASVDFAFAEDKASLDFSIQSPLQYMTVGYLGPDWTADLEATAGPELKVTGGIGDLFSWIGVTPPDLHWTSYHDRVPLAGSPALTVSARAAAAAGGPISLVASLTPGFQRGIVRFIAYPVGGGQGFVVAHAKVTGGTARATWRPAPSQSGIFQVRALLFDPTFGYSGFPYASTAEPVAVTATSPLLCPITTCGIPGQPERAGWSPACWYGVAQPPVVCWPARSAS
jgi:hypothetical protein